MTRASQDRNDCDLTREGFNLDVKTPTDHVDCTNTNYLHHSGKSRQANKSKYSALLWSGAQQQLFTYQSSDEEFSGNCSSLASRFIYVSKFLWGVPLAAQWTIPLGTTEGQKSTTRCNVQFKIARVDQSSDISDILVLSTAVKTLFLTVCSW